MTIIALQAEEYAKKELLAQEEAVKAMTSGEKMDLEALAELVASKLRVAPPTCIYILKPLGRVWNQCNSMDDNI